MGGITRRSFLRASAGVIGASALSAPLFSVPRFLNSPDNGNVRIYTVFFRIAPSRDDTSLEPMPNDKLIRRLKNEIDGVDFIVRDFEKSVNIQTVLNEMKDLKNQNFDGVLIYGWPRDYDILRTGLPTINIYAVGDFMNYPYPIYKENKVLPAVLDLWDFTTSRNVSSAMYKDLVEKIKLIRTLKRMKGKKILTVTDSEHVNVIYGDVLRNPPPRYNEIILDAINETFGIEVEKIGTKEVVEDEYVKNLWYSENKEANKIAKRWIKNAEKMINTLESEVVRSAKCYMVMRMLMKKYNADAMAFHIRTLIKDAKPEDRVFPALATSEFQLDNVVAKCQSHLNIILTEMLGQYSFSRPSMLGDYAVDTFNNTSMIQHCEGPWNPWGGDKMVPYILTDHRERQVRARSKPGVGAASWILYPGNEPVTMWQIDLLSKEILVHTGKSVPMLDEFAKYKDHFYEMI